ncbi:sodium-dependent nutrient amino acid transporter 1-like isoform X1 [Hermetia illucens]|uniref:sodium-dependent nutrient amino acid transporter 1-like isoform X1 n=1 Tax=Hermetia illucens TaxID=343691 RepID=UPI0018CC352E|nr:sodium-dependent nutrient amino acid transporter 1-like isoform X1 [Hermetia illucens]
MAACDNKAFEGDDPGQSPTNTDSSPPAATHPMEFNDSRPSKDKKHKERDLWGKEIEFLLSCIAMSVGLGNVWRFPFTALENGGGAFVIPYLIVLFLVGKPIYYLEMLIGQFSSRGSVKVFDLCPAMRGIGFGQLLMVCILLTYYAAINALICHYMFESFQSPVPWGKCYPDWPNCIDSDGQTMLNRSIMVNAGENSSLPQIRHTSSEIYFVKEVLKEVDTLDDGIGAPNWKLVLCLIGSWIVVYIVLIRGIKSSGKASYFLAIFPYVVLFILLIRAVTLPGSLNGIIYFIKPQWEKILEPKVWYAAVTQVFFSLSVCFGNIIMYSSYNKFGHDVYKDATIVTLLDTGTSLLAGFTIFGILGHLAYEVGTEDVGSVVKGGTGLAFISYPDAIAKFETLPQAFSVLFFLMLFVLGVGSNIAMTSCVMTSIRDNFPKVRNWHAALAISVISIIIGLVYVTPGGQFILNLVDYFGASLIALVLAIAELFTLGWIYGVRRICKDTEFMIGRNPGLYWRLCWGIITPILMTAILIYTFVSYEPLQYKGQTYPAWSYAVGWCISALGVLQLPIWICVAVIRQPGDSLGEKFRGAFRPTRNWGPTDPATLERYRKFYAEEEEEDRKNEGIIRKMWVNVFK